MRLKIYNSLMGLCVAAAAVSCSDALVDDVNKRPVGGEETDMISFMVADDNTRGGSLGNRPGSSTRSSVTTTDNMHNNAFAVYGDMTNLDSSNPANVFNGTEVEDYDNDDKWTYPNLKYWFSDRLYSFTAIHPATNVSAVKNLNYTDNSLSFSYSPSSYTDAVDIMTATHRRNSSVATTPVNFEFHHILSRINFKATVDPTSSLKFVISKLALTNVTTGATYTITPASTGNQTNDFHEEWTNLTESTANLFNLDGEFKVDKDNPHEFFPVENALMVIPQDVPNDLELMITYYREGDQANQTSVSTKLKSVTISAHNGVWQMGKAYTYTFTLGENESIIFNTPIVQNWNDAEGGNYVITD